MGSTFTEEDSHYNRNKFTWIRIRNMYIYLNSREVVVAAVLETDDHALTS